MHLEPMVGTWRSFEQDENAQQLSFEEKLSLMVDRLWTWRQNLALERRLRYAKLRGSACVEDIDYRASRAGLISLVADFPEVAPLGFPHGGHSPVVYHDAHRIELRGESMRKAKTKKPEAKSET